MFSASTKEAIKVALSIVLAISLALWFQWEKPYWAAIAVAVMALNESFAHSLRKGHNRLLGTVMGICYAFFLIIFFSQERALFLVFFTLYLALCIFMASNEKYGYAFTISFAVCSIVACMGGFDSQTTFHFAVLRIQETLLGVACFSFIYRLLWPISTEQNFIHLFDVSRNTLINALSNSDKIDEQALITNEANLSKLVQLLHLPLTGSYHLKQYREQWIQRVQEMATIQRHLQASKPSDVYSTLDNRALLASLKTFDERFPQHPLIKNADLVNADNAAATLSTQNRTFSEHLHQDWIKVLQGVSMFVTSLLIWIYLPVPGGFIFPMLAGVFSSLLPTMPARVLKDAFFGVMGTGSVILLQYIFVMPLMTELWQLCLFYFINVVAIWKLFSAPALLVHRSLGINLLVVLTSGALNLTPSFHIETPLLMLVSVLLVLMIAKLFSDGFKGWRINA